MIAIPRVDVHAIYGCQRMGTRGASRHAVGVQSAFLSVPREREIVVRLKCRIVTLEVVGGIRPPEAVRCHQMNRWGGVQRATVDCQN